MLSNLAISLALFRQARITVSQLLRKDVKHLYADLGLPFELCQKNPTVYSEAFDAVYGTDASSPRPFAQERHFAKHLTSA